MKIVASSGHGKYVRGASGYIDEVDEARLVVEDVAASLRELGVETITFHDNTSHDQNTNLNTIVKFHNKQTRDYDVSVHFNANKTTSSPVGTEVWYASSAGKDKATPVVNAIATSSGLKNRGVKQSSSLFFLNNTEEPAILIEVCFVDSKADVDIYKKQYNNICDSIAEAIAGSAALTPKPPWDSPEPTPETLFYAKGKCSYFGGPQDTGVSPSEGLAFIFQVDQAPHLFLPYQPAGTTGLARRLDPEQLYVACRWDYSKTSKSALLNLIAKVRGGGREFEAYPADWGPNENTGRVADLSPGLMAALGVVTDDEVEVTIEYQGAEA